MKKIGLCFSGGGARGAYQIGVAQALSDLNILQHVSCYSGTSIGAVNAVVVATSGLEKAKNQWFQLPENALVKAMPFKKRLTEKSFNLMNQGIFKLTKLEKELVDIIDFQKLNDVHVYATLADGGALDKGVFDLLKNSYHHYIHKQSKAVYVPLNELEKEAVIKSLIASCSIPIVFSPVKERNKKYYDGGLFDNIPITPLIENGCDRIIIIHSKKPRIFSTERYKHIEFIEIQPQNKLPNRLKFDSENAKDMFQRGYDEGMQLLQTTYQDKIHLFQK